MTSSAQHTGQIIVVTAVFPYCDGCSRPHSFTLCFC